jgi:hypothetical protein
MKDLKMTISGILLTIAAVGLVFLAIMLYNREVNENIINIGWLILCISNVFGWLPIFTFKKWGGIATGQSYIRTTVLVDRVCMPSFGTRRTWLESCWAWPCRLSPSTGWLHCWA